ncbi:DUF4355 domain-containing protein [Clostridioides difficile]|jgi:hypothetical protein|uniref:DUF4355 domain-containing protein n=1 Tax=Clostridioides difficile TaxID=1496 RepID=A0A9P3WV32_CLODI|nr:DUF4355 domain-containing protein [Clostridioides difficile]AWH79529.1 DUF4355 domain-containing protein [Clostridioides difficile]AWH83586.1 DUF4355 domain-containing protein [Clostridioides difficile]EGT2216391.1 DUF4355 domain-containing protein [Clostridioides difficile]EGT3943886.1 DUF4355 domain-containing protein [Clostridioides difficile]EGT3946265.1 DUF4355 domain-containing protein [Clostridioides difficile]
MLKKEVLELLKEIEDDAEIDSLLQSTDLFKSASDKKLTIEEFRELINNDANFKAIIDSEKNKYHSEALENFKKKDMQTLISAEVLKRTGANETEEQKAIRELRESLNKLEKEKQHAEKISKYKDILVEKKIPTNLIEYLLSDDDDKTNANIEIFENSMKQYVQSKVDERIKDGSYVPPGKDSAGSLSEIRKQIKQGLNSL